MHYCTVEVYTKVDDFCKDFLGSKSKRVIYSGGKRSRDRKRQLSVSELVTILVTFHLSGHKNLKQYYLFLCNYHRKDYPGLVSYSCFVQLIPTALDLTYGFLQTMYGDCTGISFIDSTPLQVCKPKRASRNKVFRGIATIGKSTIGWFFGFKLHIVVNEVGDLLSFYFTSANTDDRKPVPALTAKIFGKLFADKGYISKKLFLELFNKNLKLVTGIKDNMKNALLEFNEKILLRKRSIIETIFDQLKNICQVEHSRHRSKVNFLVNLIGALAAYSLKPTKPAINFNQIQTALIQN